MTRLTFGGGTEYRGYIVVAFDVSLCGKVKITAVRLRLTCEGVFQILFGFATFQRRFPLSIEIDFQLD